MRTVLSRSAVAALAVALLAPAAAAQMGGFGGGQQAPRDTVRRVHIVPGQRDGVSMFPLANYQEMVPKQWGVMDFQHYHTTGELNYWMKRWADERPEIVERYEVGK